MFTLYIGAAQEVQPHVVHVAVLKMSSMPLPYYFPGIAPQHALILRAVSIPESITATITG
jgi:hypothetical protein